MLLQRHSSYLRPQNFGFLPLSNVSFPLISRYYSTSPQFAARVSTVSNHSTISMGTLAASNISREKSAFLVNTIQKPTSLHLSPTFEGEINDKNIPNGENLNNMENISIVAEEPKAAINAFLSLEDDSSKSEALVVPDQNKVESSITTIERNGICTENPSPVFNCQSGISAYSNNLMVPSNTSVALVQDVSPSPVQLIDPELPKTLLINQGMMTTEQVPCISFGPTLERGQRPLLDGLQALFDHMNPRFEDLEHFLEAHCELSKMGESHKAVTGARAKLNAVHPKEKEKILISFSFQFDSSGKGLSVKYCVILILIKDKIHRIKFDIDGINTVTGTDISTTKETLSKFLATLMLSTRSAPREVKWVVQSIGDTMKCFSHLKVQAPNIDTLFFLELNVLHNIFVGLRDYELSNSCSNDSILKAARIDNASGKSDEFLLLSYLGLSASLSAEDWVRVTDKCSAIVSSAYRRHLAPSSGGESPILPVVLQKDHRSAAIESLVEYPEKVNFRTSLTEFLNSYAEIALDSTEKSYTLFCKTLQVFSSATQPGKPVRIIALDVGNGEGRQGVSDVGLVILDIPADRMPPRMYCLQLHVIGKRQSSKARSQGSGWFLEMPVNLDERTLKLFLERLLAKDVTLETMVMGHSIANDFRLLKTISVAPSKGVPFYDTCILYNVLSKIPDGRQHSLECLLERLELSQVIAKRYLHISMFDAYMSLLVCLVLIQRLSTQKDSKNLNKISLLWMKTVIEEISGRKAPHVDRYMQSITGVAGLTEVFSGLFNHKSRENLDMMPEKSRSPPSLTQVQGIRALLDILDVQDNETKESNFKSYLKVYHATKSTSELQTSITFLNHPLKTYNIDIKPGTMIISLEIQSRDVNTNLSCNYLRMKLYEVNADIGSNQGQMYDLQFGSRVLATESPIKSKGSTQQICESEKKQYTTVKHSRLVALLAGLVRYIKDTKKPYVLLTSDSSSMKIHLKSLIPEKSGGTLNSTMSKQLIDMQIFVERYTGLSMNQAYQIYQVPKGEIMNLWLRVVGSMSFNQLQELSSSNSPTVSNSKKHSLWGVFEVQPGMVNCFGSFLSTRIVSPTHRVLKKSSTQTSRLLKSTKTYTIRLFTKWFPSLTIKMQSLSYQISLQQKLRSLKFQKFQTQRKNFKMKITEEERKFKEQEGLITFYLLYKLLYPLLELLSGSSCKK